MAKQRPPSPTGNPALLSPRLLRDADTLEFIGFDLLGGSVRVGDTERLRHGHRGRVDRRLMSLSMVAIGKSDLEIADKLVINHSAVARDRQVLFDALEVPNRRSSAIFPAAVAAGVMVVTQRGPRENFPLQSHEDLEIARLGAQGLTLVQIASELSSPDMVVGEQMISRRVDRISGAIAIGTTGLDAVVTGAIVTGWDRDWSAAS